MQPRNLKAAHEFRSIVAILVMFLVPIQAFQNTSDFDLTHDSSISDAEIQNFIASAQNILQYVSQGWINTAIFPQMVVSFFTASNTLLTRDQFERFIGSNKYFDPHKVIQWTTWNQYILNSERQLFESGVRQSVPLFHMFLIASNGSDVTRAANASPAYGPITYCSPEDDDLIGFDVYNDVTEGPYIRTAAASGQPVSSEPFLLRGLEGDVPFKMGMTMYTPLYSNRSLLSPGSCTLSSAPDAPYAGCIATVMLAPALTLASAVTTSPTTHAGDPLPALAVQHPDQHGPHRHRCLSLRADRRGGRRRRRRRRALHCALRVWPAGHSPQPHRRTGTGPAPRQHHRRPGQNRAARPSGDADPHESPRPSSASLKHTDCVPSFVFKKRRPASIPERCGGRGSSRFTHSFTEQTQSADPARDPARPSPAGTGGASGDEASESGTAANWRAPPAIPRCDSRRVHLSPPQDGPLLCGRARPARRARSRPSSRRSTSSSPAAASASSSAPAPAPFRAARPSRLCGRPPPPDRPFPPAAGRTGARL